MPVLLGCTLFGWICSHGCRRTCYPSVTFNVRQTGLNVAAIQSIQLLYPSVMSLLAESLTCLYRMLGEWYVVTSLKSQVRVMICLVAGERTTNQ